MREDVMKNFFFIFQRMSADYINIQSEKDKLAEDNARLMEQLNKMQHRNGFGYRTKLFCSSIPMFDFVSKPIKVSNFVTPSYQTLDFPNPKRLLIDIVSNSN